MSVREITVYEISCDAAGCDWKERSDVKPNVSCSAEIDGRRISFWLCWQCMRRYHDTGKLPSLDVSKEEPCPS